MLRPQWYCGSTGTVVTNGYVATLLASLSMGMLVSIMAVFRNAPGTNTSGGIITPDLGRGTHKFRRRFTKSSGVICLTLSNTILVVRDVHL